MIHEISVEGLARLSNPIYIDVRSESEFAEATIPGAINIPLFSDGERAEVGTAYKQISPVTAKELGLKIAAPKLPDLFKRCRELANNKELVFFCWRGGMRSKALAGIMDLMGMHIYRLEGGYKAYRRNVVQFFEQDPFPYNIVVIRGNTGTGKTQLIQELIRLGKPAVDLEQLANNRGSVFGAVGLGPAPSQKNFEAWLMQQFIKCGSAKWVLVECESKRIGKVMLPNTLHKAMQLGKQVLLYDSVKNRVERLVADYTAFADPRPELKVALSRLHDKLGHKRVEILQDWLDRGEYADFAQMLLEDYYDALYGYPNSPQPGYDLAVSMEEPMRAIEEIGIYLTNLAGVEQVS